MIILTASRVALFAAVGAVLGWAAKALAIWAAGGLGQSPAEDPLFFVGLLCALTAVVSLAVAASQGRHGLMRVVVPLAWIAAVVLVATALDWLVTLPEPADPSWVWDEMELWAVAVAVAVTLLAAALLQRRLADDPARSPRTG